MTLTAQVFEVQNGGSFWLAALCALGAGILLLTAASSLRPIRVELSADELTIRGSVYGRAVDRQDLQLEQARVVSLASEPGLAPRFRTNGIGMPHYQVGWFRLRDRQRALCFLTNKDAVLYLPTTQNYVLLLSPERPAELLELLKSGR